MDSTIDYNYNIEIGNNILKMGEKLFDFTGTVICSYIIYRLVKLSIDKINTHNHN